MSRTRTVVGAVACAALLALGVWSLLRGRPRTQGGDGDVVPATDGTARDEPAGLARPADPARGTRVAPPPAAPVPATPVTPVVRGVVVSPEGRPLGAARVWRLGGDRRIVEVRSGADGAFEVDGGGWVAARPEHSFDAPEQEEWVLPPADGSALRLVVQYRDGVAVRVTNADGAEVRVWLSTGNRAIGRGPDEDGVYRFWNVPRDTLVVTATASDGRARM